MSAKKLHIVLLSYHDSNGGAGIAAGRLKVALESEGHRVDYLVREKASSSNSIKFGNGLVSWLKFIAERLFFLRFEKDKYKIPGLYFDVSKLFESMRRKY